MDSKSRLPVMESFYTIQGEGAFSGTPAYFIRLAGCDVGCHWCDVKESWAVLENQYRSIDEISIRAAESGAHLVVITGGEPFMYNLTRLTKALKDKGLRLNIETSGAYPFTGYWDWICFSPKKFKEPMADFYRESHELKVIIFNKSDLPWAETHARKMNDNAMLYLQPEWSREKEMLPIIVDYVKNNPKWRISLQTHKYMDIP